MYKYNPHTMNLYNYLERDFHQSLFVAPTIIAIVARIACACKRVTGYGYGEHIGGTKIFFDTWTPKEELNQI